MPGIVVLTIIVILLVIIWLFLHDSRQKALDGTGSAQSRPSPARQPRPVKPQQVDSLEQVDVEALAGHVKELRRAVSEGLIGRDEAIASIVRHADGKVSDRLAAELLDREDPAE
jgi:hypothetical protein